MKTVIGVFQDRTEIETSIDKFNAEGFNPVALDHEDAEYYGVRVNEGAFFLAVPTRENQLDLVMTIFDDCNTSEIKTISQEESIQRQYAHAHLGEKGGKTKKTSKRLKKSR